MRKLILAVSSIATVVTAAVKDNMVPPTDTCFKSYQEPGGLRLSTDFGNLQCWLELRLHPNSSGMVVTHGKDTLRVVPRSNNWVSIYADSSESAFTWAAGKPVVISDTSLTMPFVLEDWLVHLSEAKMPADSKMKSEARTHFEWLWWACLALSIAGIISSSLWPTDGANDKVSSDDSSALIEDVISRIDGASKEETRRMRHALRMYLLKGATVAEVLEATMKGLDRRASDDIRKQHAQRLVISALGRFSHRVASTLAKLLECFEDTAKVPPLDENAANAITTLLTELRKRKNNPWNSTVGTS